MKLLFKILILITLPFTVFSQTQNQWLKYGDKSFQEKDYLGASIYYKEAMNIDSSNLPVVYKYAESLRLQHNYILAERYYKYILKEDQGRAYPEALFWLATMQKNNAKYLDARKNFLSYNKSCRNRDSYYYKKSKQEIKSCEFALELVRNPIDCTIYNLGDSINTVNTEFAAIIKNDSSLYFSSLQYKFLKEDNSIKDKNFFSSIYKAEKLDTLWIRKEKLDSVINQPSLNNANGSFSRDGKLFYFTRCDEKMGCKIYVSEIVNDKFLSAHPLNETINLLGTNSTQPSISIMDSSEVLFFVSDRPGGLGGLDIWYSIKKNNSFTKPINAGPKINSIEDDISPFYDTVSHTLFFSSPWHFGLGGFDIFKSKRDSSIFSDPENIGFPLNSSANDLYFTYNESSLAGFLTSNRKGSVTHENETCCNDLWTFNIIKEKPIEDSIVPVVTKNPLDDLEKFLPIKLYFHNDEPNPKSRDTITTLSYSDTYIAYTSLITVYQENYSEGLSGEKKQAAEDTITSFFNNYIDQNFNHLKEFSQSLLNLLQKGYKLEVTVKGHASPLANSDYNYNLTLRRISSLENYFRQYDGGVFNPYLSDSALNGGSLRFIKAPFGEYKAEEFISDNLNDKKNSVYSIAAALNRNIEIASISLETKDSLSARISFKKEVFNFKELKSGETVSYTFKFKNIGRSSLSILNIESSCECLTSALSSQTIAPGESGEIKVTFDTNALSGKRVETITLITNGVPEKKEISITAEVK